MRFAKPKSSGSKYHGRIITITHEDGKVESHLLPAVPMYRDLSAAHIEFEQYTDECMCAAYRRLVLRRFKRLKIFGGIKAAYFGLVRMIYG